MPTLLRQIEELKGMLDRIPVRIPDIVISYPPGVLEEQDAIGDALDFIQHLKDDVMAKYGVGLSDA